MPPKDPMDVTEGQNTTMYVFVFPMTVWRKKRAGRGKLRGKVCYLEAKNNQETSNSARKAMMA